MNAQEQRPELTYDGKGINGPDEYRSRLATFTSGEAGDMYGPLFSAAPALLSALKETLDALYNETAGQDESPWIAGVKARARKAIEGATQ